MRRRAVVHLAWATIATAGIVLEIVTPASTDGEAWMWPMGLMPFPLAGALLLLSRPGNRVAMVLSTVGAAAGFLFVGGWAAMRWFDAGWSPYLEVAVASAVPVTFWGLVALLYIFPTGRSPRGWPRVAFGVVTAAAIAIVPTVLVRPGPLDVSAGVEGVVARDNPLGFGPDWLVPLFDASFALVILGGVLGLVSVVLRFRRSRGVERAQLKVFLTGAAFLVALLAVIAASEAVGGGSSRIDPILTVLVVAGFWGVPAAVVTAVLRYRLYDIDRLVSRTISYAAVLVLLGGLYAGLVVALGSLLPTEGDLPVAVSTLVVALVFLPLVRRVQRVVDRRFFRSRYDAGVVVASFADDLRGSLDLAEVTGRVGSVVDEVFAPVTVGVWVAEEGS